MRLKLSKKQSVRSIARLKNKVRIRRKVNGTAARPRLCVYRSTKHFYAQLVDDETGTTIASASSLSNGGGSNRDAAKNVGLEIAKKAAAKSVKDVVFDRSGYVYHGRVKALAEGAREGGLNF